MTAHPRARGNLDLLEALQEHIERLLLAKLGADAEALHEELREGPARSNVSTS